MGADTSKPRDPAEKVKKEKKHQKATQQVPHVDMSVSPWDKALDKEPCDLIFETSVGLAVQLSSPGLLTPESQRPQYGALLPSEDQEKKVKIFHVEGGGVSSGGTGLEPWILVILLVRLIYRHLQEIEEQEKRREK